MRRASALNKDLEHFYCNKGQWRNESESRPPVRKYVEHLKEVSPCDFITLEVNYSTLGWEPWSCGYGTRLMF